MFQRITRTMQAGEKDTVMVSKSVSISIVSNSGVSLALSGRNKNEFQTMVLPSGNTHNFSFPFSEIQLENQTAEEKTIDFIVSSGQQTFFPVGV